jgi:hypothetical protein
MKKTILLLFLVFLALNLYSQNSFWKKKFENGTLYLALIKKESKIGTHINYYFTGTGKPLLIKVRYDYATRKYKFEKRNGWSQKEYVKINKGELIYNTVKGGEIRMKKTTFNATPKHIRNAYFKRIYAIH